VPSAPSFGLLIDHYAASSSVAASASSMRSAGSTSMLSEGFCEPTYHDYGSATDSRPRPDGTTSTSIRRSRPHGSVRQPARATSPAPREQEVLSHVRDQAKAGGFQGGPDRLGPRLRQHGLPRTSRANTSSRRDGGGSRRSDHHRAPAGEGRRPPRLDPGSRRRGDPRDRGRAFSADAHDAGREGTRCRLRVGGPPAQAERLGRPARPESGAQADPEADTKAAHKA
jgi:hypothetical protein